MLIVWATSDNVHALDREQFVSITVPPFYRVIQECQSVHSNIWLIILYGYSVILAIVMVLLAVVTRKIKRKHYKDSKKINVLVAALIIDFSIVAPLWIIFRNVAPTILRRLVYNISTTMIAILCQIILILPKILPLLIPKYQCRS
jgi:hypothetical protein